MQIITYIAGVGARWESVGGQLLASLLAALSGYQDLGLRTRMGAVFGFFMAIVLGVSALVTAIRANLVWAPAICAVVLSFEALFMVRWWIKRNSKEGR